MVVRVSNTHGADSVDDPRRAAPQPPSLQREPLIRRHVCAASHNARQCVQPKKPLPYQVLDLRDPDEYARCHVVGALNFHHTRLSRAQNYYLPEMHDYINKAGRILIVYDDDERTATKAAATLAERGVDNVFLLSGGLQILAHRFPRGMVWGELPAAFLPLRHQGQFQSAASSTTLALKDVAALRKELGGPRPTEGKNSVLGCRCAASPLPFPTCLCG